MVPLQIQQCPENRLEEALKLLHAGLAPDQQVALIAALDQVRDCGMAAFEGLFVALKGERLQAVVWIQHTTGNAAILWPPAWGSAGAALLFESVERKLSDWNTNLAQMVIACGQTVDKQLLDQFGFARLAELAYLSLDAKDLPQIAPERLVFQAVGDTDKALLTSVVAQTYRETRDVPELNDVRTPEETLDSYRTQGDYDSNNWFIAYADNSPVGVLILTTHLAGSITELIYMGIVCSARGRGYGMDLLRYAALKARAHDSHRLVLAVDTRNEPAQRLYSSLGFSAWDYRLVYARLAR